MDTIPVEEHEAKVGELNEQLTGLQGKVADLEKTSSILGEGMTFKEGWKDHLPEDLREAKFLDRMKDLPSVIKSYDNLDRMRGVKNDKPDESWDQDQVDEWYANNTDWTPLRDDFKVEVPEGVDERLPTDPEMIKGFEDVAHNMHIPPKAAQEIINWFYDSQQKALEGMTEQAEAEQIATTAQLREEIGDKGLMMARKVASLAESALGQDVMADPSVASNPTIIKLLNWMSTNIQEARLPRLDEEITLGEASNEIEDIMTNPNNRYYKGYQNADSPARNKLAQEHMGRLFRIKNRGS